MKPEDLPNHFLITDPEFDKLSFPGITDIDQVVICMPAADLPPVIPPPEVQRLINEAQARGGQVHAYRIDLTERVPCFVCNQDIVILPPAAPGDGITRVCWDCVEEQIPGFIVRAQNRELG